MCNRFKIDRSLMRQKIIFLLNVPNCNLFSRIRDVTRQNRYLGLEGKKDCIILPLNVNSSVEMSSGQAASKLDDPTQVIICDTTQLERTNVAFVLWGES